MILSILRTILNVSSSKELIGFWTEKKKYDNYVQQKSRDHCYLHWERAEADHELSRSPNHLQKPTPVQTLQHSDTTNDHYE